MNKPHKHAEVIKAWADGAEIEVKIGNEWCTCGPYPGFPDSHEYRIKPPKKTPGQVFFLETPFCTITSIEEKEEAWRANRSKDFYEKGAKAVIEAYKRGEFDEVQDKGDDLR